MLLHAHRTVVPNASTLAALGCGGGCVLPDELAAELVGGGTISGDGQGDGFWIDEGVLGACGEPPISPVAFGVDGAT